MTLRDRIRIFAAVAVPWNAIGIISYLGQVGVIGGGPPPGGAAMPALVTGAFAIGTFGGFFGSIGLALMRRWARPLLWLSLVALVIDWGWVLLFSGAGSVPIGVTVLAVAAMLAVLAEMAGRRALLA